MPQNDLVVDNDVMSRYGSAAARPYRNLFAWLDCCGSLCCCQHLLNEYNRQGSPLVWGLIQKLIREGRYSKIKKTTLEAFAAFDGAYAYTCNGEDISVARTVFRSFRKVLVSMDQRLRNDVNGFSRINGIRPQAFERFDANLMIDSELTKCALAD
jgi:hypothetical protein